MVKPKNASQPKEQVKAKRKRRSKKARTTAVDDISSSSSSSSSSSESSDSENEAKVQHKKAKKSSKEPSLIEDLTEKGKKGKPASESKRQPRSTASNPTTQTKDDLPLRPQKEEARSPSPSPSSSSLSSELSNSEIDGDQQTNSLSDAPVSKPKDLDAEFETFYLRQVTKEFADDLEKLRSAPDFKDSSVPILVRALKQGTMLFSTEEKRILLGLGKDGIGAMDDQV